MEDKELVQHLQGVERQHRMPTMRAARNLVKGFFKMERIQPDENCLEIGCGLGFFGKLVPEPFCNRIVQTDSSEGILAIAQQRCPEGRFAKFDATAMPEIADESLNRVFAVNVCNFLRMKDLCKALAEIKRVLRPGGTFYSFLDLQPNSDQLLEPMAREKGIPLEHARISQVIRDGIVMLKVVDCRDEDPNVSAMAALLGGSQDYKPSALYFAHQVLQPLLEEFFPSHLTHGGLFEGRFAGLLAPLAPVFVDNTPAKIHGLVRKSLAKMKIVRMGSRYLEKPSDIAKCHLGKYRAVEVCAMYVQKGVKE